jgi:glycosyltransferase involved in cell wall biosynthesis
MTPDTASLPFVSCVMPTYNRRQFVPRAVHYFLEQDYERRELMVVDDGTDPIADLLPDDPRIRYIRLDRRRGIGEKRNLACEAARGAVIMHWDDDDWMAGWRIRYQVAELIRTAADACGVKRMYYYDPRRRQAWQYMYPYEQRDYVCGAPLAYTRAFWQRNPFDSGDAASDTRFILRPIPKVVATLNNNRFYVGLIHTANAAPKPTHSARWHSIPLTTIQAIVGADWEEFHC